MTSKPSLTNCPKLSCGSQGGYTVSFRQAFHFCLSLLYVTLYAPVEVLPIEGERRGDRRRTAGHGGFLIREEALRRKMWGLYLYIRNKKRTFAAEIEKSIRNLRVREHTKRPSGVIRNT